MCLIRDNHAYNGRLTYYPSEFPSLSGNQPQRSHSTWAASGNRNIGPSGNMHLQQQSALSSQQLNAQQQTQQQQDELFSSSSQLPSGQGGFRFGSQNAVGQSAQSNAADDFPPLNRNANGEIGQDRIQNLGFNAQTNGMGFGSVQPSQPSRNNGLLNALSGSSRIASGNRVASPASLSGWCFQVRALRLLTVRFKECQIRDPRLILAGKA
jgi:CCR4-NOT transcription complex subunit 2